MAEFKRPRKSRRIQYASSASHDCSAGINNLPQELLFKILHYYVESEGVLRLLSRISKVCRLWRSLSVSPSLWTVVDDCHLKSYMLPSLCNRKLLSSTLELNLSYIGKLFGSSLRVRRRVVKQVFMSCPKLKTVDLSNMYISHSMLEVLGQNCLELEHITIRHSRLFSNAMQGYFNLLQNIGTNIIFLNLSANVLSDNMVSKIALCCPNIRQLNLVAVQNDQLDMGKFPVSLFQSKCPKLQELMIGDFRLDVDQNYENNGFPELELFSGWCRASDSTEFKEILKSSSKLKILDIPYMLSNADTLLKIPATDVETLNLSFMLAEPCPDIREIIVRWRHSLKSLSLSLIVDVKILEAVICVLEGNNEDPIPLEKIYLIRTRVTLPMVKRIIARCTNLNFVSLTLCNHLPSEIRKEFHTRQVLCDKLLNYEESST